MAAQEVRVSFGDNDAGGGWNNVAAEQLNSGVAVALTDVTGDLSGIELHGFGHLDASWNAYDPKDFGLGNSGIWNGGVSKGPFTSDAAQEYVFFESAGAGEFFLALSGLELGRRYRVDVLAATEQVELGSQAHVVVSGFNPSVSVKPDRDSNGTPHLANLGGQGEINTLTQGWQSANWLIWDGVIPGVAGLLPAFGLPGDGGDVLLLTFAHRSGFPVTTGSSAAINALRIVAAALESQTITFGALAEKQEGDVPFELTATASSGLPVSYSSSDPAVASISGSTVTIVGVGMTTITASQEGDGMYKPAADVSQDLVVVAAAPVILQQPESLAVSVGETAVLSVVAQSSLPLAYQWRKGGIDLAGETAGVLTLQSVGLEDAGSYTVLVSHSSGSTESSPALLDVMRLSQSITFGALAERREGDVPFDLTATASSGLPVSYSSSDPAVASISGSTVTIVGVGMTTITASQVGDGMYEPAADVSQDLVVVAAAPVILQQPESLAVSVGETAVLSVVAQSSLPLAYQWRKGGIDLAGETAGVLTLQSVGLEDAGSYTVLVSHSSGSTESSPALLDVMRLSQTITFGALADKQEGDVPFDLTATASSGLPVSYSSSDPAVASISGSTVTIVGVGTTTITASQEGDGMYEPAADVSQDLVVLERVVQFSRMVAVGSDHSLILKDDGTLWAFGRNSHGQLGDGTLEDRDVPVQVADGVIHVAAYGNKTVFIRSDNTAWACGDNSQGALGVVNLADETGDDWFALPVQVMSGVEKVVCSIFYNAYLAEGGAVWLSTAPSNWGRPEAQFPYLLIENGIAELSSSQTHLLMVEAVGGVQVLGHNIGYAEGTDHYSDVPLPVLIDGVVSGAAGNGYSLLVKADGSAWGVGSNRYGQLGDGGTADASIPVQVMNGIERVWSVNNGQMSFFLTSGGELLVAGFSGSWGGDGAHLGGEPAGTIKTVFLESVESVAGSGLHSLFFTRDGRVWAAGDDNYGQLGHGYANRVGSLALVNEESREPVPVYFPSGHVRVGSVAVGPSHYLFATTDGAAWVSGENRKGQLGDGSVVERGLPAKVMDGVREVAAGQDYSLLLKHDGTLWAAGSGVGGQLGTGREDNEVVPVQVASGVKDMVGGYRFSLILMDDGSLWVTTNTSELQWVADGVRAMAANAHPFSGSFNLSWSGQDTHALLVKEDGTLWGWGDNTYGQLGELQEVDFYAEPRFLGVSGVDSVAAGQRFSMFLKDDGSVWSVGENKYGQLGSGVDVNTSIVREPAQIFSGAKAIASGRNHTLILAEGGALWGVGGGSGFALGLGKSAGSSTPVMILSRGVESIGAGNGGGLFTRNDGTAWSMGRAVEFTTEYPDGLSSNSDVPSYIPVDFGIGTPPVPELNLDLTFGGSLELTWPGGYVGWQLEVSDRLGDEAVWVPVGGVFESQAGGEQAVLPADAAGKFYRIVPVE